MKNRILKFYLVFMVVSLGLFSCENHRIEKSREVEMKSEGQHNLLDSQPGPKAKRIHRKFSRSSNLC